jgi:tRNA(Ile)-lysidine synthase
MLKGSAPQKSPGAEMLSGLRLPGPGIKILVAVSGGLDSMVLLHVLKARAAARRWKLSVAHFNHCLRGRDSDQDEALVRRTAAMMKLPFFTAEANVREFAAQENLSIEMAARRLRHDFYAHTARLHAIKTVALAHHADDQVELFFLRLLRGAGGSGLGGMQWLSPSPADERICLVRPLLNVSRTALEEFARENQIRFRVDATNLSADFLRNRIRHELLPLLRRNYQTGLNKTILRSMEIAGAESNFIANLAQAWLRQHGYWRGSERADHESSFVKTRFEGLPEAIQRQVLKFQIIELGIAPDFELIEMLRNSPEKPVTVSADISISRNAGGRVLLHKHSPSTFDEHSVAIKLDTADCLVFDGVVVKWGFERAHYLRKRGKPPAGTEFFDADKIGKEIVLRHWRAGDRFHPIGLRSPVKLQDLFTNAKVRREKRHQLIVAEARDRIFWVEGLRISENFKLTAETERVLTWKWRRHKEP